MMMRRKTWFGVGLCATAASVPVADDAWPHEAEFPAQAFVASAEDRDAGRGGESGASGEGASGEGASGEGASGGGSESGEGGESGESGDPGAYAGGTFAEALAKLLAGEGGEGGLGLSNLKRSVTIPALDAAQISQTVSGNTLRRDELFAFHFDPAGTFSGWEYDWETVDSARCLDKSDPDYELDDGVCYHSLHIKIAAGRWSTRDGRLCTEPAMRNAAGGAACTFVALVLDNVALFAEDGKMIGKGNDLVRGRQLDERLP